MPRGARTLNAQNLSKLGVPENLIKTMEDDLMSEFSVLTAESEILPQENVLDLKISNLELSVPLIEDILGVRNPLPS